MIQNMQERSSNPYVRRFIEQSELRVIVTGRLAVRAEKAKAARAAMQLGRTLLSSYRSPWLYLQLGDRIKPVRVGIDPPAKMRSPTLMHY